MNAQVQFDCVLFFTSGYPDVTENCLGIDKSIVEYVFDLQRYILCFTWILRVKNTHTLCTVILVQDQVRFLLLSYCY